LPQSAKLRSHFHRFMRHVHQRLDHYQGTRNPLLKVADDLTIQARIICFDEFFVSDITDAMLLAGLLEALFERGIVLVVTSNIAPQELYENGLQRQRFLPVIDLLQKHTRVVNVDGGVDYRLRTLDHAELYHFPLDKQADISLEASFSALSPLAEDVRTNGVLQINNRDFNYRKLGNDLIWFDFVELCDGPRSQNDYLELASEFHALVISGVPQMSRTHENQARRFINLVDICYESSVKLIISAAVELPELYCGVSLNFAFQRTLSRLIEMQSHEYLARGHVAH
jgi:cell division protein ZapE